MSDLLRVLLVEDNPGDADLIVEMLPREGSKRFEADIVARLAEAVERINATRFDIILLDLGLPDSDGLATLRSMQRQAPQFPIIVLTGNSDEQVALTAIQEGAQDYLVKGQTDENLLVRSIKYAIERKMAEDSLRASEAKYRRLHESLMDAYCRVDMSGQIVDFNMAFVNLLGYSEEEIRGLTYVDITPARWHAVEARIVEQQVISRGYSDVYEKEYRRKDGTLVPIELRTSLLKDENGRPSGMWAIVRDISERKRAEAALKDREKKYHRLYQEFHALLDNLPDGIAQIAPDHGVIWANRSLLELVKADETQLKGNCCYQAFWNFRKPCVPCPVVRSINSGKLEEAKFTAPGGRMLELRAVPIFDESGKVESVIEVIRNITEQRKLEDQLRQAQKMESIGTLAGGIAHDFNNILTAIIGYGQIALLKLGPDDPLRLNLEHMLGGCDRAAHLTKDLLIFSRKQICEKKPVDLIEIVKKVEKFLVRVIGEDINFSLVLHSEAIVVNADAHQLEQVLLNLATNARDAMAGGGDLIISVEQTTLGNDFVTIHRYGKPGRYALVTISDTGHGMDAVTRKNIFEPFFTTKEVGKGTGLGLAVVYGIVKQHDGLINVYSEPGIGTTFKLYLPIISSELREEEADKEEEPLARGTETILLAEDDESVRDLARYILEQQGYTVIKAVDGIDAVKKFMEYKDTIHLLLFDLLMPNMNGKEAYEEIKTIKPGIKVLFVSGYAPDFIRQKLLIESGVALVYKPIAPHALLKEVRTLLNEGEV
jgi:two-component system, cell cycle sensor histidine kinase and response regulator CckA